MLWLDLVKLNRPRLKVGWRLVRSIYYTLNQYATSDIIKMTPRIEPTWRAYLKTIEEIEEKEEEEETIETEEYNKEVEDIEF